MLFMKKGKNNSATSEIDVAQQQQALDEWLQNQHLFCNDTFMYIINGNPISDSWRKKQYEIKGKEWVDNALEVAQLYNKLAKTE